MRLLPRAVLLAVGMLPAAWAQFQFSVVVAGAEQPVATVYDLGSVASGDATTAHFRLRNTSNATAMLTLLEVAGTGFTLSAGPSLPVTLIPQAAVDFTVSFAASLPGSYSAAVRADGVSAQLAAEVVPGLTFQVETAVGPISLGSSVEFGSAPEGQGQTLRFDINNQTRLALPVPAIALSLGDFAFSGAVPTGAVQPGQTVGFDVQFLPTAAGQRNATLSIGGRSVGLTGTGLTADSPKPQITIDLPQAQSAKQGSVRVTLDHAAAASGSGTLSLVFRPAVAGVTDPTIAFASGGLTATFTFGAGDTQASFGVQTSAGFQTGTTAGTLVFTAQVGGASMGTSVPQAVTIAPAVAGLTTAGATRSAASITVRLDGFDNTRTAAALRFSFFDTAGAVLAGPLPADAGPAFQTYFGGSDTGGSFVLEAVFPVTGDPARIASFTASLDNQAGTTTTARTTF
jgi:hypothetical protein